MFECYITLKTRGASYKCLSAEIELSYYKFIFISFYLHNTTVMCLRI